MCQLGARRSVRTLVSAVCAMSSAYAAADTTRAPVESETRGDVQLTKGFDTLSAGWWINFVCILAGACTLYAILVFLYVQLLRWRRGREQPEAKVVTVAGAGGVHLESLSQICIDVESGFAAKAKVVEAPADVETHNKDITDYGTAGRLPVMLHIACM